MHVIMNVTHVVCSAAETCMDPCCFGTCSKVHMDVWQKAVRDTAVLAEVRVVQRDPGLLKLLQLIDGPGGTGKPFTVQHIVDFARLEGHICVVTATTALAASLYDGGETLHSVGKLTLMKRETDIITSQVKAGSQRAGLLEAVSIIVIDEVNSLHRAPSEVFLAMLREIQSSGIVVLTRDFRQIAPIVPFGNRHAIVNASPAFSTEWNNVTALQLKTNHRAAKDPESATTIMAVAEGRFPTDGSIDDVNGGHLVNLKDYITEGNVFSEVARSAAIRAVFGERLDEIDGAAILAVTNEQVIELRHMHLG